MRNFLLLLLVVISLFSCDDLRKFDEYKTIKNATWIKGSKIEFTIPIVDTISKNNVFINIRNNQAYEFNNIFLIAKIEFPDGLRIVDTLEYEMTDNNGHFLGQGYTDIKQNKLYYKENVQFYKSGNYKIQVEQAMRKNGSTNGLDSLKGITDVGLRIENIIE